MFRINRRTDYAVRVMLALARHPYGTRRSTAEIQNEMRVPRPYLRRIVAELSAAGLIFTFPGPNGGLQLSRPAETIHLRHIWEAIEGPLLISPCLKAPGQCPLDAACPVRGRWGRLQAMILGELEASTLSRLAEEAFRLARPIPAASVTAPPPASD